MESSRIYLSPPHMSNHEQQYIQDAFNENLIAQRGKNIDCFENDIENFLEQNVHVCALNSGTSAIHLGLIILDVKSGDEVICQSFTFSASANPIIYLGATPIFIDSETDTWNMCPRALEEAILDRISKGKRPKVIIAVHLYGMPFKILEVRNIADKYGIPILEDSAEALGSTYMGQKCGTFGDIGVFSFNGNKIITASCGGVLISKQKQIKEEAIFLATQARDDVAHYQHRTIGYNYRMSNICAGIGRGQMHVIADRINQKREMHFFYKSFFENNKAVKLLSEPSPEYFSNHWLSAILIDPEKNNDKTAEDLRRDLDKANIESRPLWKPMHLQPVFEKYPYYGSTVSQSLFNNGLCLPSGTNTTIEEKKRIINVLQYFF